MAWHTDRGRDALFSRPHLVLYGGIALAGDAIGLWALRVMAAAGVRAAGRQGPLALAVAGTAITLAAAPIDDVWHQVYGRDAVIWSRPHIRRPDPQGGVSWG